ncbi:putative ABC transporter (apicoplast) [Toxoplasma gondii RH]|uniref:Ycf24 homolog n=1 Tax=Toxoplasma gondii TaxID=5811 RepID=Q9MTD2_TOXGO|nr:putative ABC transporter [Toxoplasma gondii RH]AAD41153.1 ycf24 homolog [Toxoplasma gondii]|eukprot:NP_044570.1 putative ABC transporter (apicoplast) [Toxoplasma gondii RH]
MKLYKYLYNKYNNNTDLFNTVRLIGGLNINMVNKLIFKQDNFIFLYIFRLNALSILNKFKQPDWCFYELPEFAFDDISYYSIPLNVYTNKNKYKSILSKLGLELKFSENLILDVIFDSVLLLNLTTFFLIKMGLFFLSFFQSIIFYPYLIFSYLGSIVSNTDNFFLTINSIIFNEGSFCFVMKDLNSNINLTTYFRTHSENFAQFERTLIVLSENSKLIYFEGCSAPMFLESQLHIAIVELFIKTKANLKYSTIQNWYRGNQLGEGGLYNFTTKRGFCMDKSFLNWIQIEIGSVITWKYPSTYLIGNKSFSNFFSLAMLSDYQVSDTGTKMLHIGKNTKSFILSKSLSFNFSFYTYRGLVTIFKTALNSYNYTECNSLLIGCNAFTATIPYTIINNFSAYINQEATISKLELDFLFFLLHRGLNLKSTLMILIYGYCYNICSKISFELELEVPLLIVARAQKLFY